MSTAANSTTAAGSHPGQANTVSLSSFPSPRWCSISRITHPLLGTDSPHAASSPASPPVSPITAPSSRNSARMCPSRAPTDFHTPISFVRSSTLVNRVLVMPMAATRSEMRANRFSPAEMSVTSRFTDL